MCIFGSYSVFCFLSQNIPPLSLSHAWWIYSSTFVGYVSRMTRTFIIFIISPLKQYLKKERSCSLRERMCTLLWILLLIETEILALSSHWMFHWNVSLFDHCYNYRVKLITCRVGLWLVSLESWIEVTTVFSHILIISHTHFQLKTWTFPLLCI